MSKGARAGFREAVVLGLSSSGPAQTVAVSLAGLVGAVATGGSLVVMLALLPMLGIALGYLRLNRWDPRAGATFNWVARIFHPYLGFLAGWMILMYYTLGTTSLTLPAGAYTLALIAPSYVDKPVAVVSVGLIWNVLLTALAVAGLRPAAKFELLSVVLQYLVIGALAVAGLFALWHGQAAEPFSMNWFTLKSMGGMRGVSAGLLVACFMYSGWDAAVYLNEESEDGRELPGRAAVASVVLLAVFYAIALLGLSAVLSSDELSRHGANALDVIAPRLLGRGFGPLTSLIVLLGTLATLQAAVISAARVGAAMAREGVLPRYLSRRDDANGSPRRAVITMGLINVIFLLATLAADSVAEALGNVVSSLGLMAVVYYGLTAAAAVWQGRRSLTSSWLTFLFGGVLPAAGLFAMIFVAVEAVLTDSLSHAALAYGAGAVFVGLLTAVLLDHFGGVAFFRRTDSGSA
jgi:amino acid transporter